MNINTEATYINLIRLGKKLEAIRLYSTDRHCSIAESKDYIDKLEKMFSTHQSEKADDSELISLIQNGKKIQAIKMYRDRTNESLKASKDYVESLERSGNLTQNISGKTNFEGCFIATVCYGGYDTPEVLAFRRFRDEVLTKSTTGKIFIKLYYKLSPNLSKIIRYSSNFKIFIRKYILDKILKCIDKIN